MSVELTAPSARALLPYRALSMSDVAKELGRCIPSISLWIKRGCPHNRKNGRRWVGETQVLLDLSEVRTWKSYFDQSRRRPRKRVVRIGKFKCNVSIRVAALMSNVSQGMIREAVGRRDLRDTENRIDPLDWLRWDARERALMSPEAAGRSVSASRRTVMKWIELGLPCERRGEICKIHQHNLHAWMRENVPTWGQKRQRYAPVICSPDPRPGVIYGISDPKDGAIRYIGKTANLVVRKRNYRKNHHTKHLRRWFEKVRREGREPQFQILQECLPGMMNECEKEWIAKGRKRGWKLINITEGGEGSGWVDEARQNASEKARGDWNRSDYRAKHDAVWARRKGMTIEQFREWRTQRDAERERNRAIWLRNKQSAAIRQQRKREAFGVLTPLTHQNTVFVPLTNSKWALIDTEDWPRVSQYRWSANQKAGRRIWRVKTNINQQFVLLNRFVMDAKLGEMISFRNGDQLDCRRCNLLTPHGGVHRRQSDRHDRVSGSSQRPA